MTERTRSALLRLLICFSFVNLQFLPMWREIVYRDESSAYFLPTLTATAVLGTLIAYVLASLLVFAVVLALTAARSNLVARIGAVVLVISLVNPLTMNGYPLFERSTPVEGCSAARNSTSQLAAARELDRGVSLARLDDYATEKIRFPDETGDVMIQRFVVKLPGPTGLDDAPVEHDADGIAHGERFFLVVGHQDKRDADVALQGLQFDLHFLAQLAIERRQWLVQEQHRRPVDQGAGQGDALLLPAGPTPSSPCPE